jgi:hypothetical protein
MNKILVVSTSYPFSRFFFDMFSRFTGTTSVAAWCIFSNSTNFSLYRNHSCDTQRSILCSSPYVRCDSSSKSSVKSANDIYYKHLLGKRCVFVTGSINDDMAKAICAQLLYVLLLLLSLQFLCTQICHFRYLEHEAPGEIITMYISSSGGSSPLKEDIWVNSSVELFLGAVYPGLAIYDLMKIMRSPVHTVCMGHCEVRLTWSRQINSAWSWKCR